MATSSKDTIYIDVEDEITAIIEKVVNAKHKIVALVLPKRATVFQSAVNMKLLKKAAKSADKSLVLITSDTGILAIAAVSSMHVAKTLSSKPEVPAKPAAKAEEVVAVDDEPAADKTDDDAIELDNTDGEVAAAVAVAGAKKSKKKMLRIPDFSSFRLRIGLGIAGAVLLFILWFVGFVVMPTATVTINTDTSTVSINDTATLNVGATELDLEKNVVPAARVQTEKIDTVSVPATGQKNVGEKATGTLTLTNCIKDDEQKVIPAGTTFSKGGRNYLTTEQVILAPAVYFGSDCISEDFPGFGAQKNVGAAASSAGEEYNTSEGSYSSSISGIQAFGSEMTGGSSKIIKVVSAEDVQKAEQQLRGASKATATEELKKQLQEQGKTPVDETLNEGTPQTTNKPAVDAEAEQVEVTMTITYSLLGVSEDDINKLLDNEVKQAVNDESKNIKDNGREDAKYQVVERPNEAETKVAFQTVATIGPEIDEAALRIDIAGKRRGEIEKQIEEIDGVRSVSVEYSPGWVTTTPKSAEKITIVFVESSDN